MTISAKQLIADFARAVAVGDVSIFVGAGLSQQAGLPGWDKLIRTSATRAKVPARVKDAPLRAQYVANVSGEDDLHTAIRKKIDVEADPTPQHQLLMRLPIRDFWTTNYDVLLESTLRTAGVPFTVFAREKDYGRGGSVEPSEKRITKMHGSISEGEVGRRGWLAPPVITRSDFERYEEQHPITWTRLRAAWLSNSFLFLGLSFDDPNLNLLLRLSRSLPLGVEAPPHFVVFAKKATAVDQRLQELRIDDLERAGLSVHVIDDHSHLEGLLGRLEVRCREAMLFIAGSFAKDDDVAARVSADIANSLAQLSDASDLSLASFGGHAGQVVSKQFRSLIKEDSYRPESIRFYFRKSEDDEEQSPISKRVGMTVFTELELPQMREAVFGKARASILIGGGRRSREEVLEARAHGVKVIPVAASGGAAHELWNDAGWDDLDLPDGDRWWWDHLGSDEPAVAARAATALVQRVMFD